MTSPAVSFVFYFTMLDEVNLTGQLSFHKIKHYEEKFVEKS